MEYYAVGGLSLIQGSLVRLGVGTKRFQVHMVSYFSPYVTIRAEIVISVELCGVWGWTRDSPHVMAPGTDGAQLIHLRGSGSDFQILYSHNCSLEGLNFAH